MTHSQTRKTCSYNLKLKDQQKGTKTNLKETLVEKCRFISDLGPLFASDLGPTAQVSTQMTYN